MSYIIDIIFLLILILCACLSAKRGFVRTAIEFLGFFAAFILAVYLSLPLANFTYDKFIEPSVIATYEEQAEEKTEKTVDSVWDKLPDFVTSYAENIGITKDKVSDKISQKVNSNSEEAAKNYSDNYVKPTAVKLLKMGYTVVLCIVLLIIVKLLAKALNKVFSFSVLGTFNRTLGGLLGVGKGIIIGALFCMAIKIIVDLTGADFLFFTKDSVNKSVVIKFLAKYISVLR